MLVSWLFVSGKRPFGLGAGWVFVLDEGLTDVVERKPHQCVCNPLSLTTGGGQGRWEGQEVD